MNVIEALREIVNEATRILLLIDERALDTGDGEVIDTLKVVERWDAVMDATEIKATNVLAEHDRQYERSLQQIGSAIGYGNAQSILGRLWDEMLSHEYGIENSSRGRMGVTVDDALPPIPKAAHLRRSQLPHGGYEMVPAFTVDELKAYAHAAIKYATNKAALPTTN